MIIQKDVVYDESRILSLTRDGLEYVDDDGVVCTIDFHRCCANLGGAETSPHDYVVGYRARPYVWFECEPLTFFNFPQAIRRDDPGDDFREFNRRLLRAGVRTIDMT